MINNELYKKFRKAYEEENLPSCTAIGEWIANSLEKDKPDSEDLAEMLFALSCVYMKIPLTDKAIEVLIRSKTIFEGLNADGTKARLTDVHNNLAILYCMKGEYRQALPLLRETAIMRREIFGGSSFAYADTLYNYGNCLFDLNMIDDALHMHKKSLKLRRENDAPIPDIIDSINCVGYCLEEKNNSDEALSYFKRAQTLSKKAFTENSKDYIADLFYYSGALMKIEMYSNAAAAVEKAIRLVRKNYSPDHFYLLEMYNRASECYEKLNDTGRAARMREKNLELFAKLSGENHLTYANGLRYLAKLYKIDGKVEKCPDLMLRALDIKESLIGKENIHYLKDVITCCIFLIDNKDYIRCIELIENTIGTGVYGENGDYPEVKGLLTLLSDIKDMGEYVKDGRIDDIMHLFDNLSESDAGPDLGVVSDADANKESGSDSAYEEEI